MVYAHYPNRRGILDQLASSPTNEHYFPPLSDLKPSFLIQGEAPALCITKKTNIASIGSCFAREIRTWLINHDFNFLQTATGPGTGAGSARYDRVYSTFSIRQEVERAFDLFKPITEYWEINEEGQTHLLDPHRYTIAWHDHAQRIQEQAEHKQAVYQAFTQADVLIITVGQGEVWYDERDGSVFPALPPLEIFDPQVHKLKVSRFQENLDNLKISYELLKKHNPNLHLIITTSPVPLKLTFSQNNSIVANNAMKSMLRAVVDEFVKTSGPMVHYFPAYEIVTQLTDKPFTEDGRHVTRDTVETIMSTFKAMFVDAHQQVKKIAFNLTQLNKLKNEKDWLNLSITLEKIDFKTLSIEQQLPYLDLKGEAYTMRQQYEEGMGLLLQARKLHQAHTELSSTLNILTRNNLLLALLEKSDLEYSYQLCLEIIENAGEKKSMLTINWLDNLSKQSPLSALQMCTRLLESPNHNDAELIKQLNQWLEDVLVNLS